jgi:hypothetical protein
LTLLDLVRLVLLGSGDAAEGPMLRKPEIAQLVREAYLRLETQDP